MMTVCAIIGGLLPILYGDGTGAQVMKRIAAPMIGGMIGVTLFSFLVLPAVYSFILETKLRFGRKREIVKEPELESVG